MSQKSFFMEGLIIGGVIGAAIGFLFAPQAGDQTRKKIKDLKDENQELIDSTKIKSEELINKTKEAIEEGFDKISEMIDEKKKEVTKGKSSSKASSKNKA